MAGFKFGMVACCVFWGHYLLVVEPGGCFLTFCIVPCRSYPTHCSNMPAKKDVASTNAIGKGIKGGRAVASFGCSSLEKPTEFLTEREFRERFYIPNGIFVHLVDGDSTSTKKEARGAIFFNKK